MERFCDKCGSLISGTAKFCPSCGAEMKSAVDLNKSGDELNYSNRQNSGYGAPQYGQPINQQNGGSNVQMTMGDWVGTILLCSCLGIVSIILNIVWGFGGNTPEPKKSFCKAMLVVQIIMSVLAFILLIIVFAVLAPALSNFFGRISYGDWTLNI